MKHVGASREIIGGAVQFKVAEERRDKDQLALGIYRQL